MNRLLPVVAGLVSLLPLQSGAQDTAVLQKWAAAKVVKYRVDGVHTGRVAVVYGDYEGKADVVDRITVEFSWDVGKGKIIAPVTVTDGKSELSNIRSDGTNCPPPQLKGGYEHFQSASNSMVGELIQIKGTRSYPPASVSNYPGSCSMRSIPGGKEEKLLWLGGTGPEALGMPIIPGGPVTIAADRKSFSMKGAENWVWTYTPTLLK